MRADIIARSKAKLEEDLAALDRLSGKDTRAKSSGKARGKPRPSETNGDGPPTLPFVDAEPKGYGGFKPLISEIIKNLTGEFTASTVMEVFKRLHPDKMKKRNVFSTTLLRMKGKEIRHVRTDGREFIYESIK